MFGKIFFDWVNQWRRDKPADQCEFRDRALRALTYELIPRILWFLVRHVLYFVWRFLVSFFTTISALIVKTIMLVSGFQNKKFFEGIKLTWYNFLIKDEDFADTVDKQFKFSKFYDFKELHFANKVFYTPISVLGAFIWLFILNYIISCFHGNIWRIIPLSRLVITTIFFICQTWVIVQTYKYVDKLRNKTPFKKSSFLWGAIGDIDLYSFATLSSSVILFISFLIYSAIRIGMISWIFSGLFSKAGLVAVLMVAAIMSIIFFTTKSIKIIRFIGNKSMDVADFLGEKWQILMDKIDVYLDKKFPRKTTNNKTPVTYNSWLKDNYQINNLPTKITAATLPKAQTATGRVVQVFKSKFWDTKAKVCKPYEN